jgi:cell wall-associated NlpC family hydrolase
MRSPLPLLADLGPLFHSRFADGGRGEQDADGVRLFDCWGLCMAVFECYGLVVPDFAIHADNLRAAHRAFTREEKSGRWTPLAQPVAPCVVAMATTQVTRAKNHFGVYVGGGRFVHIFRGMGVHTCTVTAFPWTKRIRGFWAWAA